MAGRGAARIAAASQAVETAVVPVLEDAPVVADQAGQADATLEAATDAQAVATGQTTEAGGEVQTDEPSAMIAADQRVAATSSLRSGERAPTSR